MRILTVVLAVLTSSTMAAEITPEIVRPTGTPQANGAVHTVRTIPEACVRLEGVFTGDAAQPYRFTAVKSAPNCRPRARYVDFAQAQPSSAKGWKFNDEIRVPNAACPSQLAVIRVWRKPGETAPPKLDAQGRARIYLKDATEQVRAQGGPRVSLYVAQVSLEGRACN
ncbi:hypothetical protein [Lysobacter tyrosinilyticus]